MCSTRRNAASDRSVAVVLSDIMLMLISQDECEYLLSHQVQAPVDSVGMEG